MREREKESENTLCERAAQMKRALMCRLSSIGSFYRVLSVTSECESVGECTARESGSKETRLKMLIKLD